VLPLARGWLGYDGHSVALSGRLYVERLGPIWFGFVASLCVLGSFKAMASQSILLGVTCEDFGIISQLIDAGLLRA
jgi:hypothetical protein